MGQLDNNLPPELVEKYKKHFINKDGTESLEIEADKCAQIAVDYADEVSENYINDLSQRDELFEALRESTKTIEWYMDACKPDNNDYTTFFNLGMNQRVENEEIIKKHEDGKD